MVLSRYMLVVLMLCSTAWVNGVNAAETEPTAPQHSPPVSQSVSPQISAPAALNINTANAEQIAAQLSGIGISKAQKIIEYREKYGPFVTLEQLTEVSGIGQSTLDKNRNKISL